MEKIKEFFSEHGWQIVKTFQEQAKKAEFLEFCELGLCPNSEKFLRQMCPNGVYKHQHESIKRFGNGKNVCLFTPTASGKTLVFQVCAMEILNKHPKTKILGVLPTKALAHDQKIRWEKMMEIIGYPANAVGKIDGGVESAERESILQSAKVILMTPDVIHAWLLRNADKIVVRSFLANLRLLMVDEVHNYSGVFGSNAAYMFRRLKHLVALCNGGFRIAAASATINKPESHLADLLGEEFEIIDRSFDSSKQHAKNIWMVSPPASDPKKLLGQFVPFVRHIAEHSGRKFIAFIDNRKQVEQAAVFAQVPGVEPFRAGY